jgi:hypothetical protein
MDCDQRAFPALQHGITVDENVRGRSFYAPSASQVAAAETLTVKKSRKRT